MAAYTLPDGTSVQADPANPEHAAWLRTVGAKQAVSTAEPRAADVARLAVPSWKAVKTAASGVVEGAARLPFLLSDLINVGLDVTKQRLNPEWMNSPGYQAFREAHKGSGWLDEGLAAAGLGFDKPTPENKYINLAAQGVGGGLASVGPRAVAPHLRVLPIAPPKLPAELIRSTAREAALPAAVAGGTGAVAGQAAQDFTGDQNPLIALGASTLVGGLAGYGLTRTPKGLKALAEAGQATTPDEWRQAAENLRRMQASGSTTATLGEAFPGASPFLGVTKEATAQAGVNPLIVRMSERAADLQNLSRRALDAVGPEVGTDVAANAAEAAAKARLQQFRNARGEVYTRRLTGAPAMPENEVRDLYTRMMELARQQQNSNDRAAIEAVAATLVHPEPRRVTYLVRVKEPGKPARFEQRVRQEQQFKTDVGDTARELKALRDSMEFNPATASTPVKLNAHSFRGPYGMVNEFLGQQAPVHYPRAEDAFRRFSENLITPAEKGPLGVMAGRSAAANAQVPATRMEAFVNRQRPADIPQTLASLEQGGGATQDMARALLQQRVRTGEGDLGLRLAGGEPGSLGQRQTQALIGTLGTNPAAFNTPVDVLRLLSRIESSAASGGSNKRAAELGTSASTAVFNALQDARVRARSAALRHNYTEAAQLLANPTAENLARLRQLAASDPTLRARLAFGGGLTSGNTLDD